MKRTRGLPTKSKTQWSNEIASSENELKFQTPKIISNINQRNVVTQKIRRAKKEAIFKKLGPKPSPTHIYRTLKSKTFNICDRIVLFCLILTI